MTRPTQHPASNSNARKRDLELVPSPTAPESYAWPSAVSTAMWTEVIRNACEKAWAEGFQAACFDTPIGYAPTAGPNPYRSQS